MERNHIKFRELLDNDSLKQLEKFITIIENKEKNISTSKVKDIKSIKTK